MPRQKNIRSRIVYLGTKSDFQNLLRLLQEKMAEVKTDEIVLIDIVGDNPDVLPEPRLCKKILVK